MNIFGKITLANKIGKAIKEVKLVYETNSETGEKIAEIINDLTVIIEKINVVMPAVGNLFEEIIAIIKKG